MVGGVFDSHVAILTIHGTDQFKLKLGLVSLVPVSVKGDNLENVLFAWGRRNNNCRFKNNGLVGACKGQQRSGDDGKDCVYHNQLDFTQKSVDNLVYKKKKCSKKQDFFSRNIRGRDRYIQVHKITVYMKLNYTPAQQDELAGLLAKYYEIPVESLYVPSSTLELQNDIASGVLEAYATMGSCPHDNMLKRVFLTLTCLVRTSPEFAGNESAEQKHARRLRFDLLRLYILNCTTREGDTIIVKNRSRIFCLENDANWFFRELVSPHLEKHLGGNISINQAQNELEAGESHHRGRRVSDPRVPRLMLGTWHLLTDYHGFRTPMPNVVCNFIIRLLQLQGVFPENTDIDTLWVRAQLRYLNGKAEKKNQESSSGS